MDKPIFSFQNNEKVRYNVYYGRPFVLAKRKKKMVRIDVPGTCDPPSTPSPHIYIERGLGPKRELSVIIEEVGHAFFWGMKEKEIRPFAGAVARLLYKQGWRKPKPKVKKTKL